MLTLRPLPSRWATSLPDRYARRSVRMLRRASKAASATVSMSSSLQRACAPVVTWPSASSRSSLRASPPPAGGGPFRLAARVCCSHVQFSQVQGCLPPQISKSSEAAGAGSVTAPRPPRRERPRTRAVLVPRSRQGDARVRRACFQGEGRGGDVCYGAVEPTPDRRKRSCLPGTEQHEARLMQRVGSGSEASIGDPKR